MATDREVEMKSQEVLMLVGLAGVVTGTVVQRLAAVSAPGGGTDALAMFMAVAYLMMAAGFGGPLIGLLRRMIRRR